VNQRFWRQSLAFGLALWLASTTIAHAQQTNGLQLDKRPGANPISPGDRLSLILTLTNNGEDELTDLVVTDVTPAGTVFFGAAGPRSWAITTPDQNATGKITWRSTEPLDPGQSVELKLLVAVRADAEGTVVSQGFAALAKGWDKPLASPAVTVPVLKPTATVAPRPIDSEVSYLPLWLIVGALAVATLVALVLIIGLQLQARRQKKPEVRDA
jgi:uncharacterized repeat protein (TIGR01451 family)